MLVKVAAGGVNLRPMKTEPGDKTKPGDFTMIVAPGHAVLVRPCKWCDLQLGDKLVLDAGDEVILGDFQGWDDVVTEAALAALPQLLGVIVGEMRVRPGTTGPEIDVATGSTLH